jgi:hypothetical protein
MVHSKDKYQSILNANQEDEDTNDPIRNLWVAVFEKAIQDFIAIEQITKSEMNARNWWKNKRFQLRSEDQVGRLVKQRKRSIKVWYNRFKSRLWFFLFSDEDRHDEPTAKFIAEHYFTSDPEGVLNTIREALKAHPSYNYQTPWEINPSSDLHKDDLDIFL